MGVCVSVVLFEAPLLTFSTQQGAPTRALTPGRGATEGPKTKPFRFRSTPGLGFLGAARSRTPLLQTQFPKTIDM